MLHCLLIALGVLFLTLQCGATPLIEIMCDINGYQVPGVVDTGSEITVMSASCARRCKIYSLLDTKYAAKVSGVGTGEIVGAVKDQSFKIGQLRFGNKLSILRESRRDLIIGLDILDRFKSEIDLSQRTVKLKVRQDILNIPLLEKVQPSAAAVPPAKASTIAAPLKPVPAQITVQELSGGYYEDEEYDELYEDVVSMEGV